MKYKITNGILLLFEDNMFKTVQKDLYISENKIEHIGIKSPREDDSYEIIDASNRLVMPGLINMHTHAYMTFMRNCADDIDFNEWLFHRVAPIEEKMLGEDAYWSTLLGCMEMIRTGTTCFTDMHMFSGNVPKAINDSGMRAYIGRGLVGTDLFGDGYGRFSQAMSEMKEYSSERLGFILSPHAIYSCSEKLLRQVCEQSDINDMLKQIHLSESEFEFVESKKKYGKTPVEYLFDIGFIDNRTILAHCVKTTENDLEIIQSQKSTIVTNPASNAKLGNGIAPISEMISHGINVCIGTDGTASNNTLNMFREMGLLSLIHKGVNQNPLTTTSQQVLLFATQNAARALNKEGMIGAIKEGAYADLIFVNLNSLSLFPNNNIVSSLCYSANGSETDSVMINGKMVMKNKELVTIDEERVIFEITRIVNKYLL